MDVDTGSSTQLLNMPNERERVEATLQQTKRDKSLSFPLLCLQHSCGLVDSPTRGKEVVVVGGMSAGTTVDIYNLNTGIWRPGGQKIKTETKMVKCIFFRS